VVITDLLSILKHSSLFRLRYISAGAGGGNAYGLAAVCAVCYPFFFYGRIYYPGPPMKVIIFFITSILVSTFFHQKNTPFQFNFSGHRIFLPRPKHFNAWQSWFRLGSCMATFPPRHSWRSCCWCLLTSPPVDHDPPL
jgi:hypothetical protein